MAALALVICLATRVKAHERWRTLLLVTQFGLFPSNLNALQLFFCRTPKSIADDDYVLPSLPNYVLRSDPSIECYNGSHIVGLLVALIVVGICSGVFPIFLFRKIRARLAANKQKDRAAAEAVCTVPANI